jgi:pyrrolysine biosynthesis protein PylD
LEVTRLRTEDIADIAAELDDYDAELLAKTGYTLRGIACHAVGIDEEKIQDLIDSFRVVVVPITSGEGVIDGFAATVKEIVAHIGFRAFVTHQTDVAGLAEALEKKSDVIMLADDYHFVALNLKSHRVVDNAKATGKGYVWGLNLMTGGLKGRRVLVIGCGPVGRSAVETLVRLEAKVSVYDVNPHRCHDLAGKIRRSLSTEIKVEKEFGQALIGHQILVDATPAPNLIDNQHITPETYISAPGVPHGLSLAALKKISGRFLHDSLQIGVATMIVDAVSQ